MKKLLVYTSKTGTVEKCVSKIRSKVFDLDIINLDKKHIDISCYDLIIIGSPIRMGMLSKGVRNFISLNMNTLLNKKVCMFICCGFNDNWKTYYDQLNQELVNHLLFYSSFGGEMDLSKQKGFDKIIAKMASKDKSHGESKLLDDEIDNFIKMINNVK